MSTLYFKATNSQPVPCKAVGFSTHGSSKVSSALVSESGRSPTKSITLDKPLGRATPKVRDADLSYGYLDPQATHKNGRSPHNFGGQTHF